MAPKADVKKRRLWRADCSIRRCGLPGPQRRSGSFLKKFAWVARANIWDLNECVSNRSYLCSTIATATSANVAPQFCLVFHSQIFAGSPAALASDKFNPNQMAHISSSRMTNLRSSPQSQLPRPTNCSHCWDQAPKGNLCERIGATSASAVVEHLCMPKL